MAGQRGLRHTGTPTPRINHYMPRPSRTSWAGPSQLSWGHVCPWGSSLAEVNGRGSQSQDIPGGQAWGPDLGVMCVWKGGQEEGEQCRRRRRVEGGVPQARKGEGKAGSLGVAGTRRAWTNPRVWRSMRSVRGNGDSGPTRVRLSRGRGGRHTVICTSPRPPLSANPHCTRLTSWLTCSHA